MQRLFINKHQQLNDFSYLHRPSNPLSAQQAKQATLVFVHATGFNSYTYRQLFEKINPGINIYALDQRGHGLTSAKAEVSELRSWKTYEQDLNAFINWLDRPVILAGHSLGGAISAKVAAQRPDSVEGLILVEPVLIPPFIAPIMGIIRTCKLGHTLPIAKSARNRRSHFPSFDTAVENYLNKGAFKTWPRSWIEDYLRGGTQINAQGETVLSCKPEWEAKTFAVSGNNPWPALQKLTCPISVIKGKAGSTLHPIAVTKLKKLQPDFNYTLLNEASHFVPMEYPDKVADIINQSFP